MPAAAPAPAPIAAPFPPPARAPMIAPAAAPPPMAVESRRLCELPLRTTVPVCTGVCLPLI
ncbi:MAG: hypothetical protein DMG57_00900 [Acidobacteria bacterium]|nr:MAG: hypothetical protein DMG57_00900 [Acidobacteriota bacterium]